MPDIAVQGQGPMDAAKTLGYDQGSQSAQQVEILQKSTNGSFGSPRLQKREQQAQIHRYAAELEWKIPPVIMAIVYNKIKKALLVAFCQEQKQAAEKENPVRSSVRRNAEMI